MEDNDHIMIVTCEKLDKVILAKGTLQMYFDTYTWHLLDGLAMTNVLVARVEHNLYHAFDHYHYWSSRC